MTCLRSQRRRSAFTLLELILALALMAMLSLSIYAGMSAGFKARAIGMRQMNGIGPAIVAMDLVQQDLQSVLAPAATSSTAATEAEAATSAATLPLAGPFVGYAAGSTGQEADSLDFYCIGRDFGADNSPLAEGFRRVQLGIKSDGRTNVLVRRVTRNLLTQTVPEPEEEILARDVVAFSVTYYDGTSWYEEWDSTLMENAMPSALQVTLRIADPTPQQPDHSYALTRIIQLPCGGVTTSTDTTTENG